MEARQQEAAARIQGERQAVMEHRAKMRRLRKEGTMVSEIAELDRQFEEDLERKRQQEAAGVPPVEGEEEKEAEDGDGPNEDLLPVPLGQGELLIPNVDASANEEENTDFITGQDRPQEIQDHAGVSLIGSIKWSFSYQKREEKSDAYYSGL